MLLQRYLPVIKLFLNRRIADMGAIAILLVLLFSLLALMGYHQHDPSMNNASDKPVTNWMGYPGAITADLIIQLLGLGWLIVIPVLLSWSWTLYREKTLDWLWLRFTLLLITLPFAATVAAYLPTPASWPYNRGMGGAIGALLKLQLGDRLGLGGITAILAFSITVLGALAASTFRLEALVQWIDRIRGVEEDGEETSHQPAIGRKKRTPVETREIEPKPGLMKRLKPAILNGDEEEEEDFVPPRAARSREAMEVPSPAAANKAPRPSVKVSAPRKSAVPVSEDGDFTLPSLELLAKSDPRKRRQQFTPKQLEDNAQALESVLQDFGVHGEIVNIRPGPVVTLYELEPSPGTKSSRVIGLADDIARSMSAVSARIAVIPGKNAIGIELPNPSRETVYLREIFQEPAFSDSEAKLAMALGKDIGGEPIIADLARMPHLLVAGTTGSGKSVAINTMIVSLLYRLKPSECKFIMIDPKMLELSVYDGIPHLLSPVVTEPGKAVVALKWTVKEMENRYRLMSTLGVRNVDGYNKRIIEAAEAGEILHRNVQTGFNPETGKPTYEDIPIEMTPLPYIVVIVDEMADLMLVAGKDIEASIQRLAQMARAAGIHIIMATQRPSVDVITGVIKANFPTRISFQVTSRIDSRTILGEQGAEQLLGQGDMLYMAGGGRITRVHGPFISDREVEQVVKHLKAQGEPTYVDSITQDDGEEGGFALGESSDEDDGLYQEAVTVVVRDGKASTSYIQRCLKIGYNRAAGIIDRMEREGIVGPANHVGKREVLVRGGRD
jgi:S-DNA-T family DNA segregation ATPase FtsK/SpoIIIE